MPGPDMEWQVAQALGIALKLVLAFLFALPCAWEREVSSRRMGLRTFPLVSMASCGYVLVGVATVDPGSDAVARILQGLITGMGFIGGGAILKGSGGVTGTATAASLWATGAVGAATGFGRYDIAVVVAVASFLTLRALTPVKEELETEDG